MRGSVTVELLFVFIFKSCYRQKNDYDKWAEILKVCFFAAVQLV
jgi:hypothetical protein